jgi:Tfp pilus assembly protein PilX
MTQRQNGIALIIMMIILAVISVLALSMAAVSATSLQITKNCRNASEALTSAHSGMEILKHFLNDANVSTGSQCIPSIVTELNNRFAAEAISNISFTSTASDINFAPITISSAGNQSFCAALTQLDSNTVRLSVTGSCGIFNKTTTVDFDVVSRGNSVFNYGVATKGPLQMSGQAEMSGVDLAVDSDVYIDGQFSGDSFSITNQASVAGNVYIAYPYASYSIGNQAKVAGQSGDAAQDHVFPGVDSAQFPTPNPSFFESFATGPVITSGTAIGSSMVLNNAKIAANTNPTFSGHVTINGVLFIKQPNVVTFAGQATVRGIIVGDGAVGPSEPNNKLIFSGQVHCLDVNGLTGEEFDDIKEQTGTFILAPGFGAEFSGQTSISNGAIAASGIKFTGQAGGTIHGSIINYSNTQPVILSGQSSLLFNRSGTQTCPAGFSPVKKLSFLPKSYAEPVL